MVTNESSTKTSEDAKQSKPDLNDNTPVLVTKHDWRTVPYWFAALAGFIYGAGFLVDFTFLTAMGVKDPMTEVLKARHIYVGLLALQFPVGLCVVLLGFIRLKRRASLRSSIANVTMTAYVPSVLTVMVLLFAFYMLIAFSRTGSSYVEHQVAVAVLFSLAILGLITARGIEDFVKEARAKRPVLDEFLQSITIPVNPLVVIRWIIFVIVLVLAMYIFWSLRGTLAEMLKEGAYIYVGLIAMIAVILWRVDKRFDEYAKQGLGVTIIAITSAICLAFSYFAILIFAARIYPYIPAGRGGGDYTTEIKSVLVFDSKFKDVFPAELIDESAQRLQSKPLFILRDTIDNVIVAVPIKENKDMNIKENGPFQWRKLGKDNKPQALFGIKREEILYIVYKNE